MKGPKHNRLGSRVELWIIWGVLAVIVAGLLII